MPQLIKQVEGKTLIQVATVPRLTPPKDRKLISDAGLSRGFYEIELVPAVLESERRVGIGKLLSRAGKQDAAASERVYELLWRQRRHLPNAWKDKSLVFAGTVWQGGYWNGPEVLRMWHDHRGWTAMYSYSAGFFLPDTHLVKLVPKEA